MKQKLNRRGATQVRRVAVVAPVLALSLIAGCSSINEAMQPDKIDYKSQGKKTASLDIPPDLTKLEGDRRYTVPDAAGTSTLSNYSQANKTREASPTDNVLPSTDGIRMERDGNQRWLVINNGMPPDKLWESLRGFWQENGFLLTQDSPETGIMETDWAENRAKIPQDIIRNTIGKVFDGLYSTSERDKFRTRVERSQNGQLEVFISHRGAQEQLTGVDKSQTVWTPRPADPELEAEFLSRLAQRLGVQKEQADKMAKNPTPAGIGTAQPSAAAAGVGAAAATGAATAAATSSSKSFLSQVNGSPALQLPEPFDRAWRSVGLSLDRVNFTVEDRDRAQGLYYVRYVDPKTTVDDRGFFGKLFTKPNDGKTAKKYRVALKGNGTGTTVTVLNDAGQPENSEIGKKILTLLDEQLH
ncbi:outer membrane protein assembly factor BamC [Cupriavidus metallidurans]|jgi:outer membrane protein assembly factor BamC|uniref:Lipoprotein n=1 Tax=Cupriavidus metallidurans (strain ATCC 43123 / DSM 2839 / NBRC 102507 / CH34) TaxID=266264 RepID=Q1LPH1_CUPMC|nr:outer membrane protein assembly factor BamC [Cupriavidus metallidurans]ABF07955.1 putative lipoprotein [Cupriavidus metallidurans CH34]AVA33236.1 outer membrane protein assembly factor BamC [Cupriavidus metallidurans]MDE4917442.1 outer membrane protein assembly factor BamC [Cupriavidus metallidurans]QGS27756.1 outer membrane protein assembly factor BamC [Cupriavidus metallidurans]UBM12092.1 outer membrane protein assembly factor BamC [Cupriavidus metallidurans]